MIGVEWQSSDASAPNYVSNNDYAIVTTDETHSDKTTRYKCVVSGTSITWTFEYAINDTYFMAAQLAALNSGITATGVSNMVTAVSVDTEDGEGHVIRIEGNTLMIPTATYWHAGVVKVSSPYGIFTDRDGVLRLNTMSDSQVAEQYADLSSYTGRPVVWSQMGVLLNALGYYSGSFTLEEGA